MTITTEPGVVGKDFLKLLKSDGFRSLVARRFIVDGEVKGQVEINIEPYVDGERQPEQRYEFEGRVLGQIYSRDGHGSTVKPERQEVVGTVILWSYDVRDFINLIRVGDRLTFELVGANNSDLIRDHGLNHNMAYLIIDRPKKAEYEGHTPGFKRVCRLLVESRIEKDGPYQSILYKSL